jgi:hypothetical protein
MQSQLDLLVAAVSGLRRHLQAPGNALQVDLLLQGPAGVHMSPGQDEALRVRVQLATQQLVQHPCTPLQWHAHMHHAIFWPPHELLVQWPGRPAWPAVDVCHPMH